MQIHPLWTTYPELAAELEKTTQLMGEQVRLRNKEIESVLLDRIHAGGKMVRPAYTLLFSKFGKEQNSERTRSVAAAIELLHMATLIHDDIIDDSPKRRGKPSIQAQYGKDVAVYAGDYLFTVCFRLLSTYATTDNQIEINTRGMERILLGELDQMHLRYKQTMTIRNYLTQISGKTAQLFSLACYSGALEGGQSERFARNGYYIGSHIGMAFQIMDDILDYSQSTENFGKPVLEDVKQGVYTSPLIYALRKNDPRLKQLIAKQEQMTKEDALEVQQLVIKLGGLAEAQKLAEKYTQKALKRIQQLPDQVEKEIIREVTLSLLNRRL
ncbi:MAG: polyprenyl synthetase family protein [Carnobacterium sp.]|uniref:Polyprenyl synthetase family protein n=1 Tax=Carnobacterium antarcticum TaxID=2126436 RepID=A0ABW4NLE0_9LACT|nr:MULTISPECIES: polyprenyl synthetase family protein [unclassified Carnobacterium]ALV22302.1 Heptaprenyl diphosphate synthase component II [Carnobacterium sp. CP1]QQP70250.1 polyprenyl synthetase family protein [Carnobacterium sp. CS13]